MSNEPERPIEKLLRGHARKRREQAGAPLELHPVNRRLLQAEVAARSRKAAPESSRVFSVLGKLLWGGAAVAVMAIIVALFVPSLRSPHEEMAKNELSLVTNSIEELPSAAVAAEPDTGIVQGTTSLAMLDSKVANEAPKQEAKSTSLSGVPAAQPAALDSLAASRMPSSQNEPAAPPPVSAPAATPSVLSDKQEKEALTLAQSIPAQTFNRSRFGAANTDRLEMAATNRLADLPAQSPSTSSVLNFAAAPAPLPGTSDGVRRGLATFDEAAKKTKDLSTSQYFARLGVPQQESEKSASWPLVMSTFALERAGGEVRIIDGDGSVYSGYIQSNVKAPEGSASNAELSSVAGTLRIQRKMPTDASSGASLTNAGFYSFFVSGTNETLKQLVSFSGSVQPSTNAVITTGAEGGAAATFSQPAPAQQPPGSIQGKLRIGGSSESDFQAVARP